MAFTFFFRDMQILELIVRHVVPSFAGSSRVRVWDAGCAMGQEAYSLAILFAENMGYFANQNLWIYATDIEESNQFEAIIRSGVYGEEELERIPLDLFQKYFKPVNHSGPTGQFQVVEGIREKIVYQRHDLLSLQPIRTDFNLILCKNVLLHFQPKERIEVIKMFHSALVPGGYLATEQTQKMPVEAESLFVKVAVDGEIFKKVGMEK